MERKKGIYSLNQNSNVAQVRIPIVFALSFTKCKQRGARWCQWVKGQVSSDIQEPGQAQPTLFLVPVPESSSFITRKPQQRDGSFSFGFHALLCSLLGPTLVFARLPTQGGNICFGWDPLFENVFLKQKQMFNILLANTSF